MHDDIGAMIEWVLYVWREEGIVDHDENTVCVGDRSDGADVDEGECGIGRCFNPDEFGFVGADQRLDFDLDAG